MLRREEKGTPAGVVNRARGPALGSQPPGTTSLLRPVRCCWANAFNLRPPLPYPRPLLKYNGRTCRRSGWPAECGTT
eukprot:2029267-Pyramimonas_sp.AAC.1